MKSQKYLTIFHSGAINIWSKESRKKSNENVIINGTPHWEYLHIKVDGNEEFIADAKLKLKTVDQLFESKDPSRFDELVRVINDIYVSVTGHKAYSFIKKH
jgi:hypothetical protein